MAIGLGLGTTRRGAAPVTRASVLAQLLNVASCTFGYAPRVGDTTTSTSFDTNARVITHDADISSRLVAKGVMAQQTYSAASSQFATFPDTASMSFGNSINDAAVTFLTLANVTDTAAQRVFLSKWDSGNAALEYLWLIGATDRLQVVFRDQSAGVNVVRSSDAAIPQGSWHLFGMTYDGRGGATAADGITLYVDGAVVASTATNDPAYVAMENLSEPPCIGALSTHTAGFMEGSLGLQLVYTSALSLAQMSSVKALVNAGWALAL